MSLHTQEVDGPLAISSIKEVHRESVDRHHVSWAGRGGWSDWFWGRIFLLYSERVWDRSAFVYGFGKVRNIIVVYYKVAILFYCLVYYAFLMTLKGNLFLNYVIFT